MIARTVSWKVSWDGFISLLRIRVGRDFGVPISDFGPRDASGGSLLPEVCHRVVPPPFLRVGADTTVGTGGGGVLEVRHVVGPRTRCRFGSVSGEGVIAPLALVTAACTGHVAGREGKKEEFS